MSRVLLKNLSVDLKNLFLCALRGDALERIFFVYCSSKSISENQITYFKYFNFTNNTVYDNLNLDRMFGKLEGEIR